MSVTENGSREGAASDVTPEEKELLHHFQNDNAVCRNAADEAECFLRWSRAAVEAEKERCAVVVEEGACIGLCFHFTCERQKQRAAAIRKGGEGE